MSELKGNTEVRMGSDKSFGYVFAAVFAIIALFPLWGGGSPRWWALAIAAVFAVLAVVKPDLLNPLNRLWFKFGMLLSLIVSPIVMGILFFVTVTPIGLIFQAVKKDPLNQKFDPDVDSYWIDITKQDTAETSMRNQF
ncbi:SxtJ family membrane protein [Phaeobacter marinintestinus]|uniref:SxtJ family membrane protein n=1 Tax=Falsiphaeobacter marinintestinus TaxID=1492905 RepID=UPI0011B614F4|nr:SxtJ family membrane protein [Phaeobacter marinintestinus]